jgi:hypothetical protein
MTDLLPIVPGCKAIIINSPPKFAKWNGYGVRVIMFEPGSTTSPGYDLWQIDIPCEHSKCGNWGLQERYLMRIDGHKEEAEHEAAEVKP